MSAARICSNVRIWPARGVLTCQTATMQIQGVTTSGIYCRADCRARPNAENVRPMPNVIAALAAGYRPCLKCRPDRLPDMGLSDTSPQVAHALRLIVDGYLDNASSKDLAKRVGYSTRQLTRLFEEEVGASPDFVARACRAHMARRLLDESDLKVTDIAFAAGFQSIRQMNRVMRDLFGFSPSELRAKRLRGDVLHTLDGGLRVRVPYHGVFNAKRMIAYLASRSIPGVEEVEGDVYRRTINTCGHPGVVEVQDGGDGQHLEVTLRLPTFASVLEQVRRVRSLFGLTRNDHGAQAALLRDPDLGPWLCSCPGLRLPGAYDPFETSIRVLVGQQISVAGASIVCGRLVERLGKRIDAPLPGSLHSLFPTANAIAAAHVSVLDMPKARARAIIGFAQAVASGKLDLYAQESLDNTRRRLQSFPGIGPWSTDLIAARAMDHTDAFPASDLGLRKSATRAFGHNEIISARELEQRSLTWRPWRTTAIAYLWMYPTSPAKVVSGSKI